MTSAKTFLSICLTALQIQTRFKREQGYVVIANFILLIKEKSIIVIQYLY